MPAIIANDGLGLFNSTQNTLSNSPFSNGLLGQSGVGLNFNVTNGNAVVWDLDHQRVGQGLNANFARTYNSQGDLSNSDGWRFNFERELIVGTDITRITGDEKSSVFNLVSGTTYQSTDGDGAHDTITFNGTDTYTYVEGSTGLTETYTQHGGRWLLDSSVDSNGQGSSYSYDGSVLSRVTNTNGEYTQLQYDANNRLSSLQTFSKSTASGAITHTGTAVHYQYDGEGRLSKVVTDLTPGDNAIVDNNVYETTYTYKEAGSLLLSSITQTDGSQIHLTYDVNNRISTYKVGDGTDGAQQSFTFDYTDVANRNVSVTNSANQSWTYGYDVNNNLIRVTSPANSGVRQTAEFAYDADDNLIKSIDGENRTVDYRYDASGNLIRQIDSEGNRVDYAYNVENRLTNLTRFVSTFNAADIETLASADLTLNSTNADQLTEHYIYDSSDRLRFSISADGRVTEFEYNNTNAALSPSDEIYYDEFLSGVTVSDVASLEAWVSGLTDLSARSIVHNDYNFRGLVSERIAYASVDELTGLGVIDEGVSKTQFVYDPFGNLTSQIELTGTSQQLSNTTLFVYDGMNRLTSTTNALNQTSSIAYSTDQIVTTSLLGATSTQTFNSHGLLVDVSSVTTDGTSLSRDQLFFYDLQGRQVAARDALGGLSYNTYNAQGQLEYSIDSTGAVVQFIYDDSERLVQTLHSANRIDTSSWYDSVTEQISIPTTVTVTADAQNDRLIETQYDAAGRISRTIDGEGNNTLFFYDGASRLIKTESRDGNNPSGARISRSFYSEDGLLLGSLDAKGYVTETKYNGRGLAIESISYATISDVADRANGSLTDLIPVATNKDIHSYFKYDGQNRLILTVDGEGQVSGVRYTESGNQFETTNYELKYTTGNPATDSVATIIAAVSNNLSRTTYSSFDELGRLSIEVNYQDTQTNYYYNDANQVTRISVAEGSSIERSALTQYNQFGEVIGEVAANRGATDAADLANLVATEGLTHHYDDLGRRIESIDSEGNQTFYFYDQTGRLTHTVNGDGEATQVTYNAFGEVEETVAFADKIDTTGLLGGAPTTELNTRLSAIASAVKNIISSNQYDNNGQLRTVSENGLRTTTYNYNGWGDLLSQIIASTDGSTVTSTTSFTYDQRGQLDTSTDSLGQQSSNQYDAFGRLTHFTDANGNTTSYDYDRTGREILLTDPLLGEIHTTYSAFGEVLTTTDRLGNVTSYTYYDSSEIPQVIITFPDNTTSHSFRNIFGEVTETEDALGNLTQFAFNHQGQLTLVTDAQNNQTENVYDTAGRLEKTIDANNIETIYSYDQAGRVLTQTIDPTGLNRVTSYEYDGVGNVLKVTNPNLNATEYVYDNRGLVRFTIDADGYVTENIYDANAQIISTKAYAERTDVTVANQANLSVWAEAQAKPITNHFVYDAIGQLRFSINAEGFVTENKYDANGNLIETIQYSELKLGDTFVQSYLSQADNIDNIAIYAGASGATVTEVFDTEKQANVIQLSGSGISTGYQIERDNGADWNNTTETTISWDVKFSEEFRVAISVETELGARSIRYVIGDSASTINGGLITHYISADHMNGNWHTITRDLQADLQALEPNNSLQQIDLFQIRGSGLLDNVQLEGAFTSDRVSSEAITQIDNAIKTQYFYDELNQVRFSINAEGYITENIYDANGNVIEVKQHQSTLTAENITSYLQSGDNLANINIYDNNPGGATITSVFDADKQTNVIQLSGAGTSNGYELTQANGNNWNNTSQSILSFDVKYSETFTIAIDVDTANGQRFIKYALGSGSPIIDGTSITHFISADNMDGNWHTIQRDLIADLAAAEPGNSLVDVNNFRIRGSGLIDAINLSGGLDTSQIETDLAAATDSFISTHYSYDSLGRVEFTVDGEGYVSHNIYDDNGRVTRVVNFADPVSGLTEYTSVEILTALTTTLDWRNAEHIESQFIYDTLGQLKFSVDPEGYVTENIYDANGQVVKSNRYYASVDINVDYDQASLLLALSDALDWENIPAALTVVDNVVTRIDGNDNYSAHTNTVKTFVDGNGAIEFTVPTIGNAGGSDIIVGLNKEGAVNAIDNYDFSFYLSGSDMWVYEFGDLGGYGEISNVSSTDTFRILMEDGVVQYQRKQVGGEFVTFVTSFATMDTSAEYTLNVSIYDDGAQVDIGNVTNVTAVSDEFVYNNAGQLRYSLDADGYISENVYDSLGQVIATHQYASKYEELSNAADAFDLSTIATNLATADKVSNYFVYDQNSQLRFTVDAENYVTENVYDALGRVVSSVQYHSKFNNIAQYDLATLENEVSTETFKSESFFVYDSLGQTRFSVDAEGYVSESIFDRFGRVIETVRYSESVGSLIEYTEESISAQLSQQLVWLNTPAALDVTNNQISRTDGLNDWTVHTNLEKTFTNGNGSVEFSIPSVDGAGGSQLIVGLNKEGAVTAIDQYDFSMQVIDGDLFVYEFGDLGGYGEIVDISASDTFRILMEDGVVKYQRKQVGGEFETVITSFASMDTSAAYSLNVSVYHDGAQANIESVGNSENRSTQYVYDDLGQLRFTVEINGLVNENLYDAYGRVIETKQHAIANFQATEFDLATIERLVAVPLNWQNTTTNLTIDGNSISRNDGVDGWNASTELAATLVDGTGFVEFTIPSFERFVTHEYGVVGFNKTTAATSQNDYDYGMYVSNSRVWAFENGSYVQSGVVPQEGDTFRLVMDGDSVHYQVRNQGGDFETFYTSLVAVDSNAEYTVNAILHDADTVFGNIVVSDNVESTITDSYAYDDRGLLVSTTDTNGSIEKYTYDAFGNRKTLENKLGSIWDYNYDNRGNLVDEITPEVEVFTADGLTSNMERITKRFAYDAFGNVTRIIEAYGTNGAKETNYKYDARGNQTTVIHADRGEYNSITNSITPSDVNFENTTLYNSRNLAVVNIDELGNNSYKTYDDNGQISYEIDKEGYVTFYQYNHLGLVESLTRYSQALSTTKLNSVDSIGVNLTNQDVLGMVVANVDSDRTIVTTFDSLGRKQTVTQDSIEIYNGDTDYQHDKAKPTTKYEYNAFGQVVKQSVALNRIEEYAPKPGEEADFIIWADSYFYYNDVGQLIASVDPEGYLTQNEYDTQGNLTKKTEFYLAYSSIPTTTNIPSVNTTENDRVTRFVYDSLNRQTSVIQESVMVGEWSGSTFTSSEVDITNKTTYDQLGRIITQTDAANETTTTAYDKLGRIVSVQEAARNVKKDGAVDPFSGAIGLNGYVSVTPTTTMSYDALGNLVTTTRSSGNVSAQGNDVITRNLFDLHGNIVKGTDALGHETYYTYDAKGKLLSESSQVVELQYKTITVVVGQRPVYDANENFTWEDIIETRTVIDEAASVDQTIETKYVYDKNGFQTEVWQRKDDGTYAKEQQKFNAFGEIWLKGTQDIYGAYDAIYNYNQAGQLVSTNAEGGVDKYFFYDLVGKQTRVELREQRVADGGFGYETFYQKTITVYDKNGRATTQKLPEFTAYDGDVNSNVTSRVNPEISQTFDRWGNVLTKTDELGNVTTYTYNKSNQLIKEEKVSVTYQKTDGTEAEHTPTTVHDYDIRGQRIREVQGAATDANGLLMDQQTRRFEYNEAGLLVASYDAFDSKTEFAYDAHNNRVATKNALGHITTENYDLNNQLVTKGILRLGATADTPYQNGINSSAGLTEVIINSFDYDAAGRKIADYKGEISDNQLANLYKYNSRGMLSFTRNASGIEKTFEYNDQGIKSKETDGLNNVKEWDYDYFGRLQSSINLAGRTTTYQYNDLGLLTLESYTYPAGDTSSDGITEQRVYEYFDNGLVKSITDSRSADDLFDPYSDIDQDSYGYDIAGRKVYEKTDNTLTDGYAYLWTISSSTFVRETFVEYDELGRVSKTRSPEESSADYNLKLLTNKYDQFGNKRSVTLNHQFANSDEDTTHSHYYLYDLENRLTLSKGELDNDQIIAGTKGINLEYDVLGQRIKSSRYKTTYYVPFEEPGAPTINQVWETYSDEKYTYNDLGFLTQRSARARIDSSTGPYGNQDYTGGYFDLATRVVDDWGRLTKEYLYKENWLSHEDVAGAQTSQVFNTEYEGYSQQSYLADDRFVIQSNYSHDSGSGTDELSSVVDYSSGYNAVGNQTSYSVRAYDNGNLDYTTDYTIDYKLFDTYKRNTEVSSSDLAGYRDGTTSYYYDYRGNQQAVSVPGDGVTDYRYFESNRQGLIVERVDGAKKQNYYYANDRATASLGNISFTEFDYNHTPISNKYPGSIPGQYVVNQGDTLQSIAQTVYGDGSLWYIIAEANGLGGNGDLVEGQTLTISQEILSRNTSETFSPYNLGEIVGDTTPLPIAPPPPSNHCATIALIVQVVVTIVVAIYAGAEVGYAAGAAIGAAVGNAAGQTVRIVGGEQNSFKGSEIVTAAAVAYVAAGVTGGFTGPYDATAVTISDVALGAAAGYATNYAVNRAFGNDPSFSWRELGSAVAGAALVSKAFGNQTGSNTDVGDTTAFDWGKVARETASAYAGSAITHLTRKAFGIKGVHWDNRAVTANAFGSGVANSIIQLDALSDIEAINRLIDTEKKVAKHTPDAYKNMLSGLSEKLGESLSRGVRDTHIAIQNAGNSALNKALTRKFELSKNETPAPQVSKPGSSLIEALSSFNDSLATDILSKQIAFEGNRKKFSDLAKTRFDEGMVRSFEHGIRFREYLESQDPFSGGVEGYIRDLDYSSIVAGQSAFISDVLDIGMAITLAAAGGAGGFALGGVSGLGTFAGGYTLGAATDVASQILLDKRGFDEIDWTQASNTGSVSGILGGLGGRLFSSTSVIARGAAWTAVGAGSAYGVYEGAGLILEGFSGQNIDVGKIAFGAGVALTSFAGLRASINAIPRSGYSNNVVSGSRSNYQAGGITVDRTKSFTIVAQSRSASLRAKYSDLSTGQRSTLLQAKAEINAGRILGRRELSTGAHFKTSHGADVTPIQHRKRARLGVNPRPEITNRSRQNSTGFVSNRDQLNIMNRANLIRSRADNPHLVNDIVFVHSDIIGTGFSKRVFSMNENLSYMSRVRFNAESGNIFTTFPVHPHAVTPSTVLKVKY